MKLFVLFASFVVATSAVAADPGRPLLLRGWEFTVPVFLEQKVHDGPDFTVTYLSSDEKKMGMGIYEGGFPQEASKGRPRVTREDDNIAGQKVSWVLWDEETDGLKRVSFEVFLAVNPERASSDKFHLFGYASSTADLNLLRSIVRSAHRKEAANHPTEPLSPSRGGSS